MNTMQWIKESLTPVAKHDSYLVELKIKNNLAFASLLRGEAQNAEFDTLIAMHNIVEALFRMGFGRDYSDCVIRGKAALLDVCRRWQQTGKAVCRAPELQALRDLMELHDAQMEVVTVRDIEKARELALREIANKKATVIKEPHAEHQFLPAAS
ncbi:MAG: hypothetical protein ACK40S_07345 [Burkholderiaceae bacterium]